MLLYEPDMRIGNLVFIRGKLSSVKYSLSELYLGKNTLNIELAWNYGITHSVILFSNAFNRRPRLDPARLGGHIFQPKWIINQNKCTEVFNPTWNHLESFGCSWHGRIKTAGLSMRRNERETGFLIINKYNSYLNWRFLAFWFYTVHNLRRLLRTTLLRSTLLWITNDITPNVFGLFSFFEAQYIIKVQK